MLSRLFSSCPALALGSQPGVPSAVLQHQGAVAEARNLQQLWNPPSITEKSPTPCCSADSSTSPVFYCTCKNGLSESLQISRSTSVFLISTLNLAQKLLLNPKHQQGRFPHFTLVSIRCDDTVLEFYVTHFIYFCFYKF